MPKRTQSNNDQSVASSPKGRRKRGDRGTESGQRTADSKGPVKPGAIEAEGVEPGSIGDGLAGAGPVKPGAIGAELVKPGAIGAEPVKPGSAEAVRKLLEEAERQLTQDRSKVSLGDYLRLLQLHREMESEEAREIKVTWVEKPESES